MFFHRFDLFSCVMRRRTVKSFSSRPLFPPSIPTPFLFSPPREMALPPLLKRRRRRRGKRKRGSPSASRISPPGSKARRRGMFSFLGRHQDSGEVAVAGKRRRAASSSPLHLFLGRDKNEFDLSSSCCQEFSPPPRLSTRSRVNFTLQRNDNNTNPLFKDLEDQMRQKALNVSAGEGGGR